jgi:hypothetical protein
VKIQSGGEDTITLTNNTFYGNAGINTYPDFGDQHCNAVVIYSLKEDTTPVNIYNNILWSNPATNSAQDLCAKNVNGDINLYNNDIHSYDLIAAGGSINNGNNFSLDPLFVNPAGGDFKPARPAEIRDSTRLPAFPSLILKGSQE